MVVVIRPRTNLTINCDSATTTRPIMAYRMVFLALVTLPESPPLVMYLKPAIIIMITATTPTTSENILITKVIVSLILTLASPLVASQVVPAPTSKFAPSHSLFWMSGAAITGAAINPVISTVDKASDIRLNIFFILTVLCRKLMSLFIQTV